jgi:hypothetical protein
MFLPRIDGDRGRPSWPADAMTSRHVLALMGSVSGKRLKVFSSDPDETGQTGRRYWSDRWVVAQIGLSSSRTDSVHL